MIEFHESEYYESLVDDDTLLIVLLLCGLKEKDNLLQRGNPDVRLDFIRRRGYIPAWRKPNGAWDSVICFVQDEEDQKEDTKVYAVAAGG